MSQIVDGVHLAAQLGRLDFLTAVLAVLAVILGLGAFPVFFYVQRRAENIARSEVERAMAGAVNRTEAVAISKLEAMLPILIEEYMKLAQNAASAETANEIAAAQENGTGSL